MGATVDESTLGVRAIELLCSRLCHDLVSPVSAIGNGVELLEEAGADMSDEAMQLIAQSADLAARRLKLFRMAFGAAGGQDDIRLDDVRALTEGWFQGGKVGVRWDLRSLEGAPRGLPKLLLVAALLCDESLPLGGVLRVAAEGGAVLMLAEGARCALRPEARAVLSGDAGVDDLTPRGAIAYVALRLAAHYGVSVAITEPQPDRVAVRLAGLSV